MRKICGSILAVLLVCSCAWADRIPDFSAFPTWGECTGDYVRIREDTDTNSEILGRLHTGQRVIVLDETLAHGDTWYEIDHPTELGSAWVFGKYIRAMELEEYQRKPLRQFLVKLNLTFGISPEKARALFGRPVRQNSEVIGSDPEGQITRVTMSWRGHEVEFLNENLVGVSVTKGKTSFGGIRIGDSTDKLEETLGNPSSSDDNSWTYQPGEMDFITFRLENGKVVEMGYQYYYDIG
ncbi:MAG: SH3 domain-containing protein [Fretibacterium sp.]|nr:SH3 domain-containing protein [Fretibacterium sp.]